MTVKCQRSAQSAASGLGVFVQEFCFLPSRLTPAGFFCVFILTEPLDTQPLHTPQAHSCFISWCTLEVVLHAFQFHYCLKRCFS